MSEIVVDLPNQDQNLPPDQHQDLHPVNEEGAEAVAHLHLHGNLGLVVALAVVFDLVLGAWP